MIARITLVVAFVMVLLPAKTSVAQTGRYYEVPQEAIAVAADYSVEWLEKMRRNPSIYMVSDLSLDDVEVTVGPGYSSFTLREDETKAYFKSSQGTPMDFAKIVAYRFPLLIDGQVIHTARIRANRNEQGKKLFEEAGEYIFVGLDLNTGPMQPVLHSLSQRAPSVVEGRFCVLRMIGGVFVVFEATDGSPRIAPVTPVAAKVLGVGEDELEDAKDVPFASAEQSFRGVIQHKIDRGDWQ